MCRLSSGNSNRMDSRIEEILLADATLVDFLAMESSHLVRETGDLLRTVFPLFLYWYKNRKNLPKANVTLGSQEWFYDPHVAFYTKYVVPSYWKIPYLKMAQEGPRRYAAQKIESGRLRLFVSIDTFEDPERSIGLGGTASFGHGPGLKLNFGYNPKNIKPETLQVLQRRLKAVLSHELEHFADERVIDALKQRDQASSSGKWKQNLSKRFSYLSDPLEVRARVTDMVRTAKAKRIPIKDWIDYSVNADELAPKERAELERLYWEEYNRRGYGNRPRGNS